MTRMEKFLEQYPNASRMKYKESEYLAVAPCAIDENLRGDMSRRSCAWSKGYKDCNDCVMIYWNEEVE